MSLQITSVESTFSDVLADKVEAMNPDFLYISHWDGLRPDKRDLASLESRGFPGLFKGNFCLLEVGRFEQSTVSRFEQNIIKRRWFAFSRFDAIWFLNDLDQLREASPFIPWSATKDNPPEGAETWTDVEKWMVSNGIFYGVIWIEHGFPMTLEPAQ